MEEPYRIIGGSAFIKNFNCDQSRPFNGYFILVCNILFKNGLELVIVDKKTKTNALRVCEYAFQHVLEAIWGYLLLASSLKKNKKLHGEAFNFGPKSSENYQVINLVKSIKKYWGQISWKIIKRKSFYEANLLKLDCTKAKKVLKWQSVLTFNETASMVATWYKNYYTNKKKVGDTTNKQIKEYENLLKRRLSN